MSRREAAAPTLLRILIVRLRFLFVFVAIGLVVANWDWILSISDRWFRPARVEDKAAEGVLWYCPMHPGVTRNEPSNCPSCGMPLSRRSRGKDIQQAGIATSEVDYRLLVREITTAGSVVYDDRRITQVSVRIAGRVDKVHVDFKGARVKKGDPLYQVFSSGPVTTQEEFLQLLRVWEQAQAQAQPDREAIARAGRAVEAAKLRLRLWGIPDLQIAELEKTREVQTQVTVYSPASGVVFKKDINIGRQMQSGDISYGIADDSEVWVMAEVFEQDMGLITPGLGVEVGSEAFAGLRFFGSVLFIEPELDPGTRTVKACINVENRDGLLKPGAYAAVVIRVPLGKVEQLPPPDPQTEEALGLDQAIDPPGVPGPPLREVYVCDKHRNLVRDTPGTCEKCGGTQLVKRTIPEGSRLVFTCPSHPGVQRDGPGVCPKDGAALELRVVSDPTRTRMAWMCPIHPAHTSQKKGKCPDSGKEMRLVRLEDHLAVPRSAVIDTGARKTVFIDRGDGVFDAVEVVLGPRAGDYYPVLAGLNQGDRVVTAGAFLLDAEVNLKPGAASAYFGAAGHEAHR